jgi:hypothetical protein
LKDFVRDLEVLGRSRQYRTHMKARIQKLIDECGFKCIADITADAFTTWRTKQEGVGPKTLNHYLCAANAFLIGLRRRDGSLRIPWSPAHCPEPNCPFVVWMNV